MYRYELRQSRLKNYPYLCMPVANTGIQPPDYVRRYCQENFGDMGSRELGGRWYDGLMGFYFRDQNDAVQFMLAWG